MTDRPKERTVGHQVRVRFDAIDADMKREVQPVAQGNATTCTATDDENGTIGAAGCEYEQQLQEQRQLQKKED